MKIRVLTDDTELRETFGQLCSRYKRLDLAVAWCGSPETGIPYDLLKPIAPQTTAFVGVDFDHTHPEGLAKLRELGVRVHIVNKHDNLFHPKVYLFSRPGGAALLLGSANLTSSAFLGNSEAMVLLEGSHAEMRTVVSKIENAFADWMKLSTPMKGSWLEDYRKQYRKVIGQFKGARKRLSPAAEDAHSKTPVSFIIVKARWPEFYAKVKSRLRRRDTPDPWRIVLEEARKRIPGDMNLRMLDDSNVRSLLLGRGPNGQYGWFGNVAANGRGLPMFLNRGSASQKQKLVNIFNRIRHMDQPTDYGVLLPLLKELVRLRASGGVHMSMSTWGRILLLARPDVYLSVCEDGVRSSLSENLKMPKYKLCTPEGYVKALKLLHATPWFNSPRPAKSGEEQWIWDHRVAYIDPLYYNN